MTNRLLALPLVLVVLFAFSSCAGPDEPTQAPEPRTKGEKTKGDLLVGKWKFMKRTPPLTVKGFQRTIEYTKDGKVTMWHNNPLEDKPRVESGTYRVEGNTLFRTLIGPVNTLERNTTIDSITEDRLVTSGVIEGERIVTEYVRVHE